MARINNSHRTRSAEHRGLTGTEGTYASQSQFEEELLSFCKYYTMAVEKKNQKKKQQDSLQSSLYSLP